MTRRLLPLLALCVGLAGCFEHVMLMEPRFVDAPASDDCRALWNAAEARGWSAKLEERGETLTVLTADETWVLSGRVSRATERLWLPLGPVQPRAWSASVVCAPDYVREELAVRTCRVAGRSFGVVDPRRSAIVRGALSDRQHRCTLEVVAELRRDQVSSSETVTLHRSLRPFLQEPR